MYDSTHGMFFLPQRSDAWTLQGLESWQGDKAPREKYSPVSQSSRVMKDNSKRMSMARTNPTHSVAHLHAIIASRSCNRPVVDSEDRRIALAQRQDFNAGLHARPLLGQDKLAALEITARGRKQNSKLEREGVCAIKILMEAVMIAGTILEEQRRRAGLAGRMATRQKVGMIIRKAGFQTHPCVPAIGDGREVRIERRAQFLYQRWQRIGEIAIFAAPEPVALHYDMAPKSDGWLIEFGKIIALVWIEQGRLDRPALLIKIICNAVPVQTAHFHPLQTPPASSNRAFRESPHSAACSQTLSDFWRIGSGGSVMGGQVVLRIDIREEQGVGRYANRIAQQQPGALIARKGH
jgi:hypothetical protein